MFFVTSLMLSILASYDRKPSSIIQGGQSAPVQAPGAPPPLSSGGGVLDQLRQQSAPPATPAAPAGPQVPQSQ
jgi:preprotein translocase subunit SecG